MFSSTQREAFVTHGSRCRNGQQHPAKAPDPHDESLRLLARLQVKIEVLRRAKAIAPQLAKELQATIEEIEHEFCILDTKVFGTVPEEAAGLPPSRRASASPPLGD
jgi:hypothetical protein